MYKKIKLQRGFSEVEHLFNLLDVSKSWIVGGYARYCASPSYKPSPANDIDLYCKDDVEYNRLLNILEKTILLKRKYENEVSIGFHRSDQYRGTPYVNLIKPKEIFRFKSEGSLEEILDNFDFTVTKAAIISKEQVLVDPDFKKHEVDKLLVFKNIHCPISSMYRAIKYIKRGYQLRSIEMLKLFCDWQARDDEYRSYIYNALSKTVGYDRDDPSTHKLSETELIELYQILKFD